MLITDAAVREAAANLAKSLGGDWMIDTAAPADGAAHLVYSDGRGISFRPIFGGTTVQLWITGGVVPSLPDDATLAERAAREAHVAVRLPEGHRYNKATTLVTESDEDPERIILRTLEESLLPAFEYKPCYVGHRPWIDLFDNALAAVTAERDVPPAPANADENVEREPADVDQDAEPEVTQLTSSEVDAEPESPEASPADGVNDEAGDQPAADTPSAKRRPHKPTPKRRPKLSTT